MSKEAAPYIGCEERIFSTTGQLGRAVPFFLSKTGVSPLAPDWLSRFSSKAQGAGSRGFVMYQDGLPSLILAVSRPLDTTEIWLRICLPAKLSVAMLSALCADRTRQDGTIGASVADCFFFFWTFLEPPPKPWFWVDHFKYRLLLILTHLLSNLKREPALALPRGFTA